MNFNEFLSVLDNLNLNIVIIALITNLITQIAKQPIKLIINKSNGKMDSLKKVIPFLPILIAFALTMGYKLLCNIEIAQIFVGDFSKIFFSSASISLAIYAVCEKVFAKNPITNDEIKSCFNLLKGLVNGIEQQDVYQLAKILVEKQNELMPDRPIDAKRLKELIDLIKNETKMSDIRESESQKQIAKTLNHITLTKLEDIKDENQVEKK